MLNDFSPPSPKYVAQGLCGFLAIAALVCAWSLAKPAAPAKRAFDLNPPEEAGERAAVALKALRAAPLFSPDRAAEPDARGENEELTDGALTAKGVSIAGEIRAVVLAGPQGPLVMREGEERNGLRIIKISRTSVTIEKSGTRREVRLGRS